MAQGRMTDVIAYIDSQAWTWERGKAIPHGQQIVVTAGAQRATVTYYPRRDTMVIGGSPSPLQQALEMWVETGSAPAAPAALPAHAPRAIPLPHIGMDESGKGDWFGPLVVAAVFLDEPTAAILRQAGVRDSKAVPAPMIPRLAATIEQHVQPSHRHVWAIPPEAYNGLYATHKNINTLLADVYAEVASQVLQTAITDTIVCDQFSSRVERLEDAFAARGLLRPRQQPHAESASTAVAAASVLASAAFSASLDDLGRAAGLGHALPKGASDSAALEDAARHIIRRHGRDALGRYGKLNFKPLRALHDAVDPA